MDFSIREWCKIYHHVKLLGQMFKDSLPWIEWLNDGEYIKHPPRVPLNEEVQKSLEKQIQALIRKHTDYMTQCGIRPPKQLWIYSSEDKGTWPSDPSFRFGHLIK